MRHLSVNSSLVGKWLSGILALGLISLAVADDGTNPRKHKPVPTTTPQPIYGGSETNFFPLPPASHINVRTSFAIIDRTGDFIQTAQCATGEQLLGGGYLNGDSSPYAYYIAVKASYPSSENAWTAVFHNRKEPET